NFVHCKCLQGYTMLHIIEYYVVAKSGYSLKLVNKISRVQSVDAFGIELATSDRLPSLQPTASMAMNANRVAGHAVILKDANSGIRHPLFM
ncbi:MAG: hypothetical protein LC540_20435, partial [Candidatus Thiodiazotropha sp.]|nr:hypothetical protein [Candidatus Thiodiazotropha sp.]